MNRSDWSRPTDPATAYRRAAGRRAFNAQRRALVIVRRRRIIDLLTQNNGLRRDELARLLGVSARTISGDLRALAIHEAEHTPISAPERRPTGAPEQADAQPAAPATLLSPELQRLIERGDDELARLLARTRGGTNDGR